MLFGIKCGTIAGNGHRGSVSFNILLFVNTHTNHCQHYITVNKQVSCEKLPGDVSVMTYTGHRVQHTLIRCKFSPVASTGEVSLHSGGISLCLHCFTNLLVCFQRYIYTGGDGTAVSELSLSIVYM